MADFYSVLGVGRDASAREIKDAYRRLARRYHPDVNPGDKTSEAKFKQVNEAYHVLSNPKARKDYDEFGENWKHAEQLRQAGARVGSGGAPERPGGFEWFETTGGQPFESFDDLLGRFGFTTRRRAGASSGFGSPFGVHDSQGAPAGSRTREVPVEVSLEEAYRGATRLIAYERDEPCGACGATGRRGRGTCSSCGGAGVTPSQMRLEVKIPAGIEDGGRVRIRPTPESEVILVVSVRPDARFRRQGTDLYTDVEVPFTDAILGGEAVVQTVTGRIALKIPAGTPAGKTFRIAGKGMPHLGGGEKGALYAKVAVTVPEVMTAEERKLVERLRELRNGAKVR
jgi:molecular chaperone DnaJ